MFELQWLMTPESEKVEEIEKYVVVFGPVTKTKNERYQTTYELKG